MKSIVTCKEMKELDRYTMEERGVPSCVLMERAALAVFSEITRRCKKTDPVLVVCGTGNNGGDGIAIGRLLHLAGYPVSVFAAGKPEKMTEETRRQYQIAKQYHVPFCDTFAPARAAVLVDALFGVGLSREVGGLFREIIERMNCSDAFRVAVDIPSGIDGDTGLVLGCAFRADLTVTFAYIKRGLCLYPGREYAGQIVTADIGIYGRWPGIDPCRVFDGSGAGHASDADHAYDAERGYNSERAYDPDHLSDAGSRVHFLVEEDLRLLPRRKMNGHKGTFGKVLVAAGSENMCGAAFFSAAAALRCGAGMVQILTDAVNRAPLSVLLPEALISTEKTEEACKSLFGWCDALIIGPGLGKSETALLMIRSLLSLASDAGCPVVLDADGLNLLSENPSLCTFLGPHVVVTPHFGEMSRLTGKSIRDLKKDPVGEAASFALEHRCTCVLKDACTVIASPEGEVYLNMSGNDGMGTAGAGDVLSGILGGFLCVHRESGLSIPFLSAAGVFVHGLAGDAAAAKSGKASVTAGSILQEVPAVLQKIEQTQKKN